MLKLKDDWFQKFFFAVLIIVAAGGFLLSMGQEGYNALSEQDKVFDCLNLLGEEYNLELDVIDETVAGALLLSPAAEDGLTPEGEKLVRALETLDSE